MLMMNALQLVVFTQTAQDITVTIKATDSWFGTTIQGTVLTFSQGRNQLFESLDSTGTAIFTAPWIVQGPTRITSFDLSMKMLDYSFNVTSQSHLENVKMDPFGAVKLKVLGALGVPLPNVTIVCYKNNSDFFSGKTDALGEDVIFFDEYTAVPGEYIIELVSAELGANNYTSVLPPNLKDTKTIKFIRSVELTLFVQDIKGLPIEGMFVTYSFDNKIVATATSTEMGLATAEVGDVVGNVTCRLEDKQRRYRNTTHVFEVEKKESALLEVVTVFDFVTVTVIVTDQTKALVPNLNLLVRHENSTYNASTDSKGSLVLPVQGVVMVGNSFRLSLKNNPLYEDQEFKGGVDKNKQQFSFQVRRKGQLVRNVTIFATDSMFNAPADDVIYTIRQQGVNYTNVSYVNGTTFQLNDGPAELVVQGLLHELLVKTIDVKEHNQTERIVLKPFAAMKFTVVNSTQNPLEGVILTAIYSKTNAGVATCNKNGVAIIKLSRELAKAGNEFIISAASNMGLQQFRVALPYSLKIEQTLELKSTKKFELYLQAAKDMPYNVTVIFRINGTLIKQDNSDVTGMVSVTAVMEAGQVLDIEVKDAAKRFKPKNESVSVPSLVSKWGLNMWLSPVNGTEGPVTLVSLQLLYKNVGVGDLAVTVTHQKKAIKMTAVTDLDGFIAFTAARIPVGESVLVEANKQRYTIMLKPGYNSQIIELSAPTSTVLTLQLRNSQTKKAASNESVLAICDPLNQKFSFVTDTFGALKLEATAANGLKLGDQCSFSLSGSKLFKNQVLSAKIPFGVATKTWDLQPMAPEKETTLAVTVKTGKLCIPSVVVIETPNKGSLKQTTSKCITTFMSLEKEAKLVVGQTYKYIVTTPGFKEVRGTYVLAQEKDTLLITMEKK